MHNTIFKTLPAFPANDVRTLANIHLTFERVTKRENLNMSSKHRTFIDRKTNILSSEPNCENFDDGCSSFGEFIIKRLTEQGDFVVMVS